MPGILPLLSSEVNAPPEQILLWMPSGVEARLRAEPFSHCGLAKKEERLRAALCEDTLDTICALQRGCRALYLHKNRQMRGQTENARAQKAMGSLQEKSMAALT
jgi:hypothetical protein